MDRSELPGLVINWQERLDDEALGFLSARGLTDESIHGYYLGWTGDRGWDGKYRNCISIPYYTGMGALRGVRFRRLSGDPKYDHLKGEKAHLFNVGSVRHHRVFLTEGEFDAIVLEQLGYPAVGVPGANGFKEEWKWLFLGNEVRIIFDADEAGKKAARAVKSTLSRVVEGLEIIQLPPDHDVGSLFVEDAQALLELIEAYEQ